MSFEIFYFYIVFPYSLDALTSILLLPCLLDEFKLPFSRELFFQFCRNLRDSFLFFSHHYLNENYFLLKY